MALGITLLALQIALQVAVALQERGKP
jgi:hypothetical protein